MKDDEEEGQGTRGKGNRAGLTTFFRRKEKEKKNEMIPSVQDGLISDMSLFTSRFLIIVLLLWNIQYLVHLHVFVHRITLRR